MMRIMIVDDDPQDLQSIAAVMRRYYGERNCHMHLLSSGPEALSHVEDGQGVDIAVLDILMPGMTGVELAEHMRMAGYGGHIVFISASNDFAAQSYQVDATYYMLKPFDERQVHAVLERIGASIFETDNASFLILRKSGSCRVLFRELLYVEVKQHRLLFHLCGGAVEQAYGTMKDFAPQLLAEPRMIKPNQSYIINMDYIRAFATRAVVMWDGQFISVPRDFSAFQHRCVQRMLGRG